MRVSTDQTASFSDMELLIPETELDTLDEFIDWQRFHVVTSDGIIVFSDAASLMIESRLTLTGAFVQEITTKGQEAIYLSSKDGQRMLLRFSHKSDRRMWLRSLRFQSTIQFLNREVDFTPHKRRQIYFIDGTEEFQMEIENQTLNLHNQTLSRQNQTELPSRPLAGKRKGAFLGNMKKKLKKVSEYVNCFSGMS